MQSRMICALAVVIGLISSAAALACADGCSTVALSLNDFVIIQLVTEETPCSPACGANGVQYTVIKVSSCGGLMIDQGIFCSANFLTAGNYYVQSIGAGCSGTPQGCVRLCSCP